jgi:signal transduction histidine kinase
MHKLLKILVVDDDEIDRIAVHRGLKKAGLEIEFSEASSYSEALAMLTNGRPQAYAKRYPLGPSFDKSASPGVSPGVYDGREGVRATEKVNNLKRNFFDCVFLDYRLPDRDGLELIQELQNREIKVPLIVLTGQGDEQIAVELMKAGASDYLPKSKISPEILERTLRNAMRLYRAEQAVELTQQRLRVNNKILKRQNQELARQSQQIELQNLKLQELSQLKSQFLATMSHELRTPMNAIMGFSQLLLRQYPDPLTTQQLDIVNRIFNNSQNLLLMLNEVLDFSKIEAGHLELNPSEFDLVKLVTLTVAEMRSLGINKTLQLKVETSLENLYIVNDQNCVKRILINLVSNAIKFTETGEVKVKIRELTSQTVEIAVKDTGCGIPQESLQSIFDAFRQVDQTITRSYSGTGLGLAITDSLVKMMRGKITVTSELGKGSEFRVEFPRRIEHT